MGELKAKARRIVKLRGSLFTTSKCLKSLLDVFDASHDIDLLVWQVSLLRDASMQTVKCLVAFGNESDSLHFSRENLLTDKYIKLEESHPIMLAMAKVEENANVDVMHFISDYLQKSPLEGFELETEDNRITIKMDEKTICERKESEE